MGKHKSRSLKLSASLHRFSRYAQHLKSSETWHIEGQNLSFMQQPFNLKQFTLRDKSTEYFNLGFVWFHIKQAGQQTKNGRASARHNPRGSMSESGAQRPDNDVCSSSWTASSPAKEIDIYRLWDELGDFDSGDSKEALAHCMRTLCDWIGAQNAFWSGIPC